MLPRKAITLATVLADGNTGGNGAYLDNSTGAAKAVTLTSGQLEFNANGANGLEILSKGLITLKDIDAIGNQSDGAYLDNTFGALGVTLTGAMCSPITCERPGGFEQG